MESKNPRNSKAIVAFLVFLAGLLIIRSFFSFCQSDESFYAALINRFWMGEKPVQDEWHRAQFYAPLLLPYYGAYMLLHGSSDGIILFLRILYLGFAMIASSKIFSLVYKETSDDICAGTAAAVTMLFSRANISGVSYYNLCMLCSVSAFCSMVKARGKSQAKKPMGMFWGGILLACSVLCNPFLAPFLFVIFSVALVRRKNTREIFYVIYGIAGMAVSYCMYLALTTGVHGVIGFLPYVLKNSEQNTILKNVFDTLSQAARYAKFVAIPALLMSIVSLADTERTYNRQCLHRIYLVIQSILLAISAVKTVSGINGVILFALTVVAFPYWVGAWRTKKLTSAREMYWLGIINAAAFSMASNTGLDAGTVGFCISGIGGIWLIRESIFLRDVSAPDKRELLNRHTYPLFHGAKVIMIVISIVVLTPLLCQRIIGIYRDAPLWTLNTKLVQGPAKGLYTTESHAKQYESICDTLAELETRIPEGRILFCKNLPWAYLVTDYEYGTESPWRVYTDEILDYYAVCHENRADYICVLNETVGGWEKSPFQNNPAKEDPNSFDYEGDFWSQVVRCPVLTQSEWLRVYDVSNLMQGFPYEREEK